MEPEPMEKKCQDPLFHSCNPIGSEESQFPDTPSAMESGDWNPYPVSSSPDPTPSDHTGIVMLSLPDTPDSVEQQAAHGEIAYSPPEDRELPASGDECRGVKMARVSEEAPDVSDIGSEDCRKAGDEEANLKSVVGDGCAVDGKELLPNAGEGTSGAADQAAESNEVREKRLGIMDFLNVLTVLVSNIESGGGDEEEEEDIEVLAERLGIIPRPRWWPPGFNG